MTSAQILEKLPYAKPFLFVDELLQIDENGVVGTYRFDQNLDFYQGHFKDYPITPGVILTETMAQIGLACLAIYFAQGNPNLSFAITSTSIDFLKPVFPSEKVTVTSKKIYFRFNKLSCKVKMENEAGEVVCKGNIAGMVTKRIHE
jgi:3-hydroxyacyl-[acyl-carrier-protein] dehydratase